MIHIFTHDSIGLGEDGPTHQPVEQLASLRAIPGLNVIRPCDANEVAEAWRVIDGAAPPAGRAGADPPGRPGARPRQVRVGAEGLRRGGYVLADADGGEPELILIATGQRGRARGRGAREAEPPTGSARGSSACRRSTSSTSRTEAYRDEVLPPSVTARVSIEEASTLGWDRYVGARRRAMIGMHTFGSSAPLKDVLDQVRLHAREGAPRRAREVLERRHERPERHSMKPTQAAPRARPEPLARQHHPDDARRRHARRLHRRALGHRADLEPDDLRQGDRRRRRLRRPDRRAQQRRASRARSCSSSSRSPTCAAPPSCSGRATSAPTTSTAGSRSRSRRCSPTTPTRRSQQAAELHGRAEEQPLHQDPRHEAGPQGDRGVDLRRRSRSTSRCCSRPTSTSPPPTPTCGGSSAASRPGSNPDVASVASLFISRWDVAVTDEVPDELRNRLGHRGRQAHLRGLPRAARLRPRRCASRTRAPGRSGCSGRAPGPRTPTPPTRSTSRRLASPFTVNTMPEKTLQAFADHGKVGEPLPAGRRRRRADAGGVRRRRRSTPTRSRRELQEEGARGLRQVLARAARVDRRRAARARSPAVAS